MYSVHFLAFAQFGETVNRCSVFHLFEEKYLVAVVLLSVPLPIPTQLCTNIIYVYLFIHIRRKLRVVDIVQLQPNHSQDRVRLKSCRMQETTASSLNTQGDTHTSHGLMIQSESEVTKGQDISAGYAQSKGRSLYEQEAGTSTAYKSKCNRNPGPDGDAQTIASNTISKHGDGSRTNNNRKGLERQRRVLITFGILLSALNLFMTPLFFLGIIETIRNRPLSRIVRFAFVAMAMLNSALNPVINIWRMKPFRLIMKAKAKKIYEWLTFWRA